MAETELSKKSVETSKKAAIEYLSKTVKEAYESQGSKDEMIRELILTLDELILDLEDSSLESAREILRVGRSSSKALKSLRGLWERLNKNAATLHLVNERLVENFTKDLDGDNSILQIASNKYLQNHDALKDLKQKQSKIDNISRMCEGISLIGLGYERDQPLVVPSATGMIPPIKLSQPIERMIFIMEMLLEEFKDQGITITPRVKTPEGMIDLLIRTDDARYFGLMLRSNGDSRVFWNKDRQLFYTRRTGKTKGKSKWSGIELLGARLNSMMLSLKAEKNSLLGNSKSDFKKGFVKVIVLTGKTRIDPANDPTLKVNFGRATALKLTEMSTYYVVDHTDLGNFLKKPPEKNIICQQ